MTHLVTLVLGWLTPEDVARVLDRIAALPAES